MAVLHLFDATPANCIDLQVDFGDNAFPHNSLASPQLWILFVTAPLRQKNHPNRPTHLVQFRAFFALGERYST